MEVRPSIHLAFRILGVALIAAVLCKAQSDDPLNHAKQTYAQHGARAALPEFEKLLVAYRQANDKRGEAIVTGLIGNCYKKLGDYPRAIAQLTTALQMKRELHDRLEEGKTLSHLGLVYWEQGAYPKAIDFLNQSMAIGQELQDAQLEGTSLNNLSLVYEEQGDYQHSLEQYQRALELNRSAKYEPGASDALGNIGGHYLLVGRYSEAEGYYRQALEISQRLGLKPSESLDLGNLAACLLGQGEIQESILTYDRAIQIAADAGQTKELADWYRGKSSALLHVGKFEEALRNYRRAGETYSKAGLKRELVENLADVGHAYLELGDRQGAERSFANAASLSKAIGHPRGTIINQLALAEISRQSGSYFQAQTNAQAALREARKMQASAETASGLLLMARILQDRHSLGRSLEQVLAARDLAARDGLRLVEAESLDQLGELKLLMKAPTEALVPLETARTVVKKEGDIELLWRVEYHRAQSLEKLGRDEEALEAYKEAVAAIEDVRSQIGQQRFRTGYLQDKQRVYVAMVRLLLKMGKSDDAFRFSEQLREYSYQNLRAQSFSVRSNPAVAEAEGRVAHLRELFFDESNRPIGEKRSQAMQFFSNELAQARRDYDVILDRSAAERHSTQVNITQIRDSLAPGAALIEYLVGDDQLAIFVLTRSGMNTLTLPIAERVLRSKVELFRELVADKERDEWRKPAASLYSLLISKLEQNGWLQGVDKLIVIPDGILNYLPFSALPQNARDHARFLIERFEISVEPSALALASMPVGHAARLKRVAAFAPARSRLRYAAQEARDVAAIFGPDGEAILGRAATKARFQERASRSDVVHVATHGFFNKMNPILSGLQFEPAGSDDGKLEVHEILAMQLAVRLVTLSACDTALGAGNYSEIPAGDEFVGLNRAFLEAGSNAVIASLWKVDDRSTASMMRSLYRRLESTGAASALAQVQRQMLRSSQYSSPYYWAPFVHFGRDDSQATSAENH